MTVTIAQKYGITLSDSGSAVGLRLVTMVRPALRRNPLRAQLLVSTVLGKHIPVDPRIVAGSGRLLGALVARRLADDESPLPAGWAEAASATVAGDDPGALLRLMNEQPAPADSTVLTIGFAETATALGHLVADQLGTGYLHSTRRRSGDVPVAAEFSEPHSHATGHLLRPASPELLSSAETVVLVDDELSTGRTALNVLEVLHAIRPRKRYVLAGLVDVRSTEADAQRAETAGRLRCRIDVVSLARGSVEVRADAAERIAADLGAADPGSTDVDPAPAPVDLYDAGSGSATGSNHGVSVLSVAWPVGLPVGGAHGFAPSDRDPFDAAVQHVADQLETTVVAAQRVLVLGTEELMYLPLRLALALSDRGGRTIAFQSTTRSPVHAVDEPGYPIRRRIEFRAFVDGGPQTDRRFLYNANWPAGSHAEPDLVVIVDDGSALPGPAGPADAVAAATGAPVVLVAISRGAHR